MLLKVLVYAYLCNIYSSRKLEVAVRENSHFKFAACRHEYSGPSHDQPVQKRAPQGEHFGREERRVRVAGYARKNAHKRRRTLAIHTSGTTQLEEKEFGVRRAEKKEGRSSLRRVMRSILGKLEDEGLAAPPEPYFQSIDVGAVDFGYLVAGQAEHVGEKHRKLDVVVVAAGRIVLQVVHPFAARIQKAGKEIDAEVAEIVCPEPFEQLVQGGLDADVAIGPDHKLPGQYF